MYFFNFELYMTYFLFLLYDSSYPANTFSNTFNLLALTLLLIHADTISTFDYSTLLYRIIHISLLINDLCSTISCYFYLSQFKYSTSQSLIITVIAHSHYSITIANTCIQQKSITIATINNQCNNKNMRSTKAKQ